MTADPRQTGELGAGERLLERWPGEIIDDQSAKGVAGWLVLTSHRCLFFRRTGLFGGGKTEKTPVFTLRLVELRSVAPQDSFLPVGYGDRVAISGIELNGRRFRLGREISSGLVVGQIIQAREALPSAAGPR